MGLLVRIGREYKGVHYAALQYCTMEILHYRHPRQTFRPGIEPRPPAPQAGTLPKSYLDSLHCLLFATSTLSYLKYMYFK
jgi:hypothetical protein